LNENTVAHTGITNAPSKGAPTGMTGDGVKKAEYTYNFANAKGNFVNNEIVNINGQSYTFGVGSGSTISVPLGNTMEESLNNLASKMPETTFIVNEKPETGKWAYNEITKKLTWTSEKLLETDKTIDANSIKTLDSKGINNLTYTANPLNIKNFDLFKTSDGSSIFTASNIKISDDWMNGSIHIISSHDPNAGTTASDNITLMIKALTDSREFTYEYNYTDYSGNPKSGSTSFYNGSFSQCYSNIENMQGIDSSSNTAILNNHISVLSETSNNKDAVSGVSLDEEGINLMQFQRSFSAAARLMTTLDQALDTLINSTGMVGR
jgi:flagellar hook-associated protein 1 FlgK